ncbi:hypothetical protein ACMHYJ_11680 [Castellaniella hirudinis]|uniref:hypothetical protein n=1 Tax=Castellaniella hirudinis TaxID=1144617 RepID=UPI0039C0C637
MPETEFQMSIQPCAIIQIEGWANRAPTFEAALESWLGVPAPAEVGEILSLGSRSFVRIAPRRGWLLDADDTAFGLDPDIGCTLALPDGRMRIRLSGERVLDVLSACLAIDWDAPSAAPGRALQTGFQKVPVMALRAAPRAIDLLAPRSLARSLTEWLAEVAGPWMHRS